LAVAIRLAHKGYKVTVLEKNAYPGGKLSEQKIGAYRFDKGPSLFTMPSLVDELTELGTTKTPFPYMQLKTLTHYFYEDGTKIISSDSVEQFSEELSTKLGENKSAVIKHLKRSAFYYETTVDIFLKQSLRLKNLFNLKTLRAILRIPQLNLFSTMNKQNENTFKNPKTVQLFNRYATYNGSSPYKAPALLNIIPHLEFGMGAYLPEGGMHRITEHLYNTAKELGVAFHFKAPVDKIEVINGQVRGVVSAGQLFESNMVVSDVDIHVLYHKLLPAQYRPVKLLNQEKSSSAYVFFWGVKEKFPQLDLHNILFSKNYEAEFKQLFENDKPYHDPTVYINITSKFCKDDAPQNCENWFVMVNVPHNKSGKQILYGNELRKNVISKINRVLNVDLEKLIEEESVLDPFEIESQTSSVGGSLYGNASNNKFSAFLRHKNYSSKIQGLYFVGGSVHPGGGIPLCLLSAKIVADMIKKPKK